MAWWRSPWRSDRKPTARHDVVDGQRAGADRDRLEPRDGVGGGGHAGRWVGIGIRRGKAGGGGFGHVVHWSAREVALHRCGTALPSQKRDAAGACRTRIDQ